MKQNQVPVSCLIVGNYCHDVLKKDDVVLAESLGGAASFISAVLDGLSVPSTVISKVGTDFSYSVTHPPLLIPSAQTTLFHAHFSSQIRRHDRLLKRIHACDPITPSDLPISRFHFGLAVGVAGEITPETLEKMLDKCDVVFVDVQSLIRVFDPIDGTVGLVPLKDSGFYHLLPRIGFLKASADEAPYVDVEDARKKCCVVVTNGKEGCTVYGSDGEQRIAPFPTVQVDPTGAGDSFLGGLVAGLSNGLAVPDAALLGNFFGSLTVGEMGLPQFDSRLLQAVKDEVQKKRLQFAGSHEWQNGKLIFMKPLDHEDFLTALTEAKTKASMGLTKECQTESPIEVEPRDHQTCNGQPKLFPCSVCEEPIKPSGCTL
ncbi:hypothetical protein RD792_010265 [Penstemon davidsonii]|uniref:Carbohydrate kinase PfkB domain-containing protein n=1 Tax=Penstemon davidsonii TaxID=160366 RepID=A0ABR0D2S0_9LAMI|nr:hypothetical protein RD792_010265 [Penstemon davidsonii]